MSDHKTDLVAETLPQPISLTPDQVRQVAAGTALALPTSVIPPSWRGRLPVPELGAGLQGLIA